MKALKVLASALPLTLTLAAATLTQNAGALGMQSWTNVATRACINDSPTRGLKAERCDQTPYQKWNPERVGAITYIFRNVATGRCMDDHGGMGNLRSFGCNGMPFQQWEHNLIGGNYVWKNVATGRCLDDSPAGLRTHPCNGLPYQKWW